MCLLLLCTTSRTVMLLASPLQFCLTVPEKLLCIFHPPFGQGCHDLILPALLPITGRIGVQGISVDNGPGLGKQEKLVLDNRDF